MAELDKLEWAPRASVGVEVQNGTVTFTGSIIDERLRGALKVIAENTPGCVAVHDHTAWIEPNSGVVVPSEGDDPKRLDSQSLAQSARAGTFRAQPQAARKKATDRAACGSISARSAARPSPKKGLSPASARPRGRGTGARSR